MREQLRLAELSFSVRFHQVRTSAVESTNRPLRVKSRRREHMAAIPITFADHAEFPLIGPTRFPELRTS
jgi:hypothetical protein